MRINTRQTLRSVFAIQLRKYRKYLGFSQDAFARKLGISKTTIVDWEKFDGRWQPSWEKLEEMCSWTGIKPVFFFMDEDFGSDHFELAERIKILQPELRNSIEGIVQFAETERKKSIANKSPEVTVTIVR